MSFLRALFTKEVIDKEELDRIRLEFDVRFAQEMDRLESLLQQGNRAEVIRELPRIAAVYCDTLERLRRLGWLYWHLEYKAMAGRCWHSQQEKSQEMEEACREFESACGDNPVVVRNTVRTACHGEVDSYMEMWEADEDQPHYEQHGKWQKEAEWGSVYGIRAEMRFALSMVILVFGGLFFALIGIVSLGIWAWDALTN